ncbi:MAG: 50S ribosomal protein L21 [Flavobacteriales bacterium]|nr:50S ribosomal protein L21 [Flavobacteriales bacterium]
MYAIVEIAGQQFKVQKDRRIFVHRLQATEGESVQFEKVMLTDDNGKIEVGAPVIDGVVVSAAVVRHLKGDKVLVFKKKRRKGYQKLNGHRQSFTEILITDIGKGKAPAKKAATKQPVASKPVEEATA